ncbi:MAG: [FeFe] hydrogenase H-cluster radical SAM maturase HydE [Propionivibrio sp.]|uniref:[FeFe] hydrogenase H-cluster radical SAM maturase HydE n=1 Tax=Propionivibrio sp. TaxID=2212460 RepID=UPI001B75F62A|nr:[FeFe] hydrogenase H-cluster radical SAM maturase HydE [Propionivibrio sp.]MBP7202207.1 [FeFe] hydrogenase H-cluster radical SAM maturase HydE [Propionivibrio sp.]
MTARIAIKWAASEPIPAPVEPGLSAEARMLAANLDCGRPNRELLRRILSVQTADEVEVVRRAAERTLLEHCGDTVRLRGLIEFSNRCTSDCHYCGIRRSNRAPTRYTLRQDEIVETACWCAGQGYGSVVLQSGERRDARFVRFVGDVVRAIKAATLSEVLPEGVGITLCVGEQSPETYAEWFAAGAHRYLLRMETSSPRLFAALHPADQRYDSRVDCLRALKAIGYRVGTGVMIGLPGQTLDSLVDDLFFFRDIGADMIGMGPYIPHEQAVLTGTIPDVPTRLGLALRMIAATRLLLPEINIAATTALQTLTPDGREQGLRFGANVIMPQVTPLHVRRDYTLYDGKPCLDDSAGQCARCLENRIASAGRRILRNAWGDPAAVRPPG